MMWFGVKPWADVYWKRPSCNIICNIGAAVKIFSVFNFDSRNIFAVPASLGHILTDFSYFISLEFFILFCLGDGSDIKV